MSTVKLSLRILRVAYNAARQALAAPRYRFIPKKYTPSQLASCPVLKEYLRLDYRGLAEHLADHSQLVRVLDLKAIPHFSTVQKAAARRLKADRDTAGGRRLRRRGGQQAPAVQVVLQTTFQLLRNRWGSV